MFALRADGLFGVTSVEQQKSFLSGLLIGHEIGGLNANGFSDSCGVLLVGANYLTKIYGEALEHQEISYHEIDGHEATARGLYAVWEAWRRKTGMKRKE